MSCGKAFLSSSVSEGTLSSASSTVSEGVGILSLVDTVGEAAVIGWDVVACPESVAVANCVLDLLKGGGPVEY